ncbi:hypothetical protein [Caldivirga maquilingensis]|uniref:Uncharacterized protein n=1 Tax=Caldivirga maquilingensis (strain ATCC 700844 / DSM 13496 / JCM 10307 / IC-167) TaxID=397948 RepID=A8MAB2_CALMQ|nr:hypothetical protein [Caldivirga maquilingensis]ABW01044.1 hypothetical protein Cmaq_0195 [Caldivirga maquilingensis IC-167]
MLLEERQKKSGKETGRILLIDWFTPAILTEEEMAIVKFTEIPLKSFINEFNDYVAQGLKIFNMLNNKESAIALRVAGAKVPSDRVEMSVEDVRYIVPGSLIFYIYVDDKAMEPLRIYKIELKG